jgi:putative addiction module component (TIGR02574 family)
MGEPAIDIERLTLDERVELIDRLWESVSEANPALTAEQREELDRRLDELDRRGPSGVSLEAMWAEIEKKST